MADMLALLKGEQLVEISEDFDYLRATEDFVGLKLFPLAKTENMKLAIYNLVDGADVPVMAFVHALDTEARIGDRPDAQELKFELFLINNQMITSFIELIMTVNLIDNAYNNAHSSHHYTIY